MTDRKVGGRSVEDRRKAFHMEPIQALAEPVLQQLYPGIYRRAETDIDQITRLFYDGAWRDDGDIIRLDIESYCDLHPADAQRTDASIKHWSTQCGGHLEGEYGQSYYRVAVHVGLLGYVHRMRELRQHMQCEHGWHRIIERFIDACNTQSGFGFISAGEKWGALSIVYRCNPSGQEVCRAAEKEAVERSLRTCEICGLRGELRRWSWWKTLCDKHAWSSSSPERQATVDAVERLRLRGEYGEAQSEELDQLIEAAGRLDIKTEEELRQRHPDLTPEYAEIEVRTEWLPLVDAFLSRVVMLYGDTVPSVVLFAAYESGGLVIDLDDRPWSGNQDPATKKQVRDLALAIRERTRDV